MNLFENDKGIGLFSESKPKRSRRKKHHRISYLGKVKPRKRRSYSKRTARTSSSNTGWFLESNRHSLASKGIKTGHRKTMKEWNEDRRMKALQEREEKESKMEQEQEKEYKYEQESAMEKEKEETVKYIYVWKDYKGKDHYTPKKPNFMQHKGNVTLMKYEDYIKKIESK